MNKSDALNALIAMRQVLHLCDSVIEPQCWVRDGERVFAITDSDEQMVARFVNEKTAEATITMRTMLTLWQADLSRVITFIAKNGEQQQ